jgi:hypothetical protein
MHILYTFVLMTCYLVSQAASTNPSNEVGKDAPTDQKDNGSANKATNKPQARPQVDCSAPDKTTADQQKNCQSPPNNGITKVEVTPSPLVVAPQPTDTWLKWYVGLTGVIAFFSVVAAWAAIKQAYATRQKERAWIIAVMEDVPESLVQPPPSTAALVVTNIYRLACKVQNKGNSPAWVTERADKMQVVAARNDWSAELPSQPDYGELTKLGDFGATLPPNGMMPATFLLRPNDAASVERGENALYVYGIVKYRDAFKTKHETRYCYRLKVALGLTDPAARGFYIAGPPKYNKAT